MPKKKEDDKVNKIPATSPNKRQEILDNIRAIYPALIHEDGTVNEKELKALSEGYTKTESERYEFKWAGKTASKRFAFTPSKARLVPDTKRSVDFDNTKNLIIEGENLEVLKLLQSSYFKKVKMIYIDPPYNTGHDFVYSDDYSESKQAYWEQNGVFHDGVRMDTNTESAGRYHSNWLSMMQSRLLLARNLLKDDGVIFVSIDDNEMHNLRKLMDDVFGEENFVAIFPWRKRTAKSDVPFGISQDFEWIVCYAKNQFVGSISHVRNYYQTDDFPNDRWRLSDLTKQTSADERPNSAFDLIDPKTKKAYSFNPKRTWAITRDTFNEYYKKGKIVFPDDYNFLKITIPAYRVFESEDKAKAFKKFGTEDMFKAVSTLLPKEAGMSEDGNKEVGKLFNEKVFSFPKPIGLLKYLTEIATSNDDLILDFFAGSGTTAHAVMELNKQDGGNRKFILVQLPEETDVTSEASKAGYKIISDITIERVKRAGKKIKAEKSDIDVGFKVYRLSKSLFPHNLFEVDPEMTEEQKTKAWEVYLEKAKQAHIFDYKLDELLVEVALKDGFDLNFKSEPIKEFKKNKVLKISDEDKTAIICLDETIHEDTVKGLEVYKDQRLICLERAVDTTSKWNLRRMFGENLWVA